MDLFIWRLCQAQSVERRHVGTGNLEQNDVTLGQFAPHVRRGEIDLTNANHGLDIGLPTITMDRCLEHSSRGTDDSRQREEHVLYILADVRALRDAMSEVEAVPISGMGKKILRHIREDIHGPDKGHGHGQGGEKEDARLNQGNSFWNKLKAQWYRRGLEHSGLFKSSSR